jgi:hypothetical protein
MRVVPWLILVVVNLYASILLAGRLWWDHAMYWDMTKLYGVFRTNAYSLNHFGQVAFSDPAGQLSYPLFYFSHLGTNMFTPLGALVLSILYALGMAGVMVNDFTRLWIFHIGFLTPLLFSVCGYLLLSQIFQKLSVRIFIIIMLAFSPGVIFNMTDPILEQSAYGILFAASFLWFYRKPGVASFIGLISASMAGALAVNHLTLYWSLIFVPLFVGAILCVGVPQERSSGGVAWYWWLCGAAAVALCLMPAMMTYGMGVDIVRTAAADRWYSFDGITSGNPMEFLTASTPGIGWNWIGGAWSLQGYGQPIQSGTIAYTYMGVLALPLCFVGLCYGRSPWNTRLTIIIIGFALCAALASWSSVFAAVLVWPTPIRACRHYCDCLFRDGFFFVVIFAAALGFDAVLNGFRRVLGWTILGSIVVSAAILSMIYGTSLLHSPMIGYHLTALVIALTVGFMRCNARHLALLIILLAFMDTSNVAYGHCRAYMWPRAQAWKDPAGIVMPVDERNAYLQPGNQLLTIKPNSTTNFYPILHRTEKFYVAGYACLVLTVCMLCVILANRKSQ